MSPTLDKTSALQHLECSNLIKVCNKINYFNFLYPVLLQLYPTSTHHYSEHKWNEQDELNLGNVRLHFSKGIQWIVVLTEIHFQLQHNIKNPFHCIQYFGYLWFGIRMPYNDSTTVTIQMSHCMRASSTSRDDALLVPSARVTTLQCLTPFFRSSTLNVSTLHTQGNDKYFMYIRNKLSFLTMLT